MIHDEIASAFFAKLHGIGPPVFKHYSNTAGERIVIQVKANTKDIFQTAQVWILFYTPTVDNLPNTTRLNELKDTIENVLQPPFTAPNGEVLLAEPVSIDGPYIDPQTSQECFVILRYKVTAR